ncbi:MAG: c-type cytochrome, partial [Sphingobacteriales bacterium]
MKKVLKYIGVTMLVMLTALFIIVQLRQNRQFSSEFPAIQASTDTTIIARGRQLVLGAAHCTNCHGAGQGSASTALSGGQKFEIPIGDIYAPNLTPSESGILYKSDEALARALRYGIKTDGTALFDFMPFHNTSDADLVAILSYLRAQPPVNNIVPKNSMNLLGKVVRAFLLKPAGPSEKVPAFVQQDTTESYGAYLANSIANCQGCHTNRDLVTGAFIGVRYAGGFTMETKTDTGTVFITSPDLR